MEAHRSPPLLPAHLTPCQKLPLIISCGVGWHAPPGTTWVPKPTSADVACAHCGTAFVAASLKLARGLPGRRRASVFGCSILRPTVGERGAHPGRSSSRPG
jgi:hypothetical protein